jgi:dTDP-4-dehydrorhamnose 3,5-epimerase
MVIVQGLLRKMSVQMISTKRFTDNRGWFSESWNARTFASFGITSAFCQDNHSVSKPIYTLRGLHFQRAPHSQAKLIRCLRGRIFDVAVDLRQESPTYKRWVGVELSAEVGNQLFVPKGYAHGFLTLEPNCEVGYKVDAYYEPQTDGGILWNDTELAIDWPLNGAHPHLSSKDATLPTLKKAELDFCYDGNPLLPFIN